MTISAEFAAVLSAQRRVWRRSMMTVAVLVVILAGCCHYAGLFDAERLANGIPSLGTLVTEMFPPDFSQLGNWIGPLADTLAMSVAGTAIAVILSVPLGRSARLLPVRIPSFSICAEVCLTDCVRFPS